MVAGTADRSPRQRHVTETEQRTQSKYKLKAFCDNCTVLKPHAHQVEVLALHNLDVPDATLELAPQHGVDLVLLIVLHGTVVNR